MPIWQSSVVLRLLSSWITPLDRQFILGNTISIGRSEQNEVMIDDAFVSHEHAIINKTKQGYWLTDLKSTNKTYLNNQPVITEILLKNGDLIKIGAVTFRFEG